MLPPAAVAGALDDFYKTIATISLAVFLLPGVMSPVAAVGGRPCRGWPSTPTTDGMKSRGACAVRLCGLVLYALIALGMAPRQVEAIVLGLLIVVGVHLTWFGLTESRETAGA